MASIYTLVPDIYSTISRKDGWFTDALAKDFSGEMGRRLQEHLSAAKGPPKLRLSKMGPTCPRALWYSIHHPDLAEALPPWAEIKYSFGHILEALAITLAKASGHLVTGEQDELTLDGVKGHRDCVIDGCIVDVKSASSFSFRKFKEGTLAQNDDFGYLDQLDGYLGASQQDDLVTVKDKAFILAIDKQLGHMCIYEHQFRPDSIRERIRSYKEIVGLPTAPRCECGTRPEGKSGNISLDVKAAYNAFKYCCNPNLRAFLYASGPVFLTKVVRKPDVPEIDRDGKIVYN